MDSTDEPGNQRPVKIAVMTVTDSRTEETDTSGKLLVERIEAAGHQMVEKRIVRDDRYLIRELVSRWIADPEVEVVISTGGTGLTGRDVTPEAVKPLFDKEIEGFGELFRWISWQHIKTSTIQSRAIGGVANGTLIFCLPGSNGACKDGWDEIIVHQLDQSHRPCNMIEIMPRLKER
ncbi:MAG TPA: molybdenum cofactor biosynthesis protein B [Gammaproteobacteria bacterium]|nr:molybdenum cofactor biosynthesis protein B [Gammaproteobacteria bacterium]